MCVYTSQIFNDVIAGLPGAMQINFVQSTKSHFVVTLGKFIIAWPVWQSEMQYQLIPFDGE